MDNVTTLFNLRGTASEVNIAATEQENFVRAEHVLDRLLAH